MKFSKSLPLFLTFTVLSLSAAPVMLLRAVAQDAPSPSFTLPTSVPDGTEVKISATSSMEQFSKLLADKFVGKFPGAKIQPSTLDSAAALQSVLDGKADLAAIGRPLTADEKAKGLTAITVARNKIAMIVGKDNPFTGGLDITKFAKIFRGEITDWSEVGGAAGPIVFVDRPATSDTRQSFAGYPVFASGLTPGSTAKPVTDDTTDAVVAGLGNNGIGFAIADQAVNNPNVRVIEMHKVLPSDPRYPFSQPLTYVYSGTPKPGVEAFLGYLTAPENQSIVEEARAASVGGTPVAVAPTPTPTATPSPAATTSPEATPTTALVPEATPATGESGGGGMPWWPWLLGAAALGGLGWLALKGRGGQPAAAPPATPPAAPVPPPAKPPATPKPTPTPTVPVTPVAAAAAAGATVAAGVAAVKAAKPLARRLILTPRNAQDAYAYWEVDEQVKADLRRQGGEQLKLRLKDVTGLDLKTQTPPVIGEFSCSETDPDLHVPITTAGRDYQAELGYRTADGQWLSIAESAPVTVPKATPAPTATITPNLSSQTVAQPAQLDVAPARSETVAQPAKLDLGAAIAGGAAAIAGAGAAIAGVAAAKATTQPAKPVVQRLILVPRNSQDAYAYWEVDEQVKADLRRQGGTQLKLRLKDVTALDLKTQTPAVMGEFDCSETDPDLHVPITTPGRDYHAELGYRTADGQWLSIATSDLVTVPKPTSTNPPPGSPTGTSAATGGISINDAVTNATGTASSVVTGAASSAANLVGNVVEQVGSKVDDLTSGAASGVTNLASGVTNVVGDGIGGLGAALAGGAAAAAGAIGLGAAAGQATPKPESPPLSSEEDSGLFDKITARATDAAKNLTGGLGGVMGKATDVVGDAAAKVGDLAGGAVTGASNLAGNVTSGVTGLASSGLQNIGAAVAGGAAAVAGAAGLGAVTQPLGAGAQPPMPKDCRIILVPRNSQDAYAYWEIYDSYRAPLRQQGGQRLMLRVHDVTNIDVDRAAPLGTQEFPIDEEQCDLHVKIPVPNRDYIAEVGYYTADNRWLRIIRSFHVRVPAA